MTEHPIGPDVPDAPGPMPGPPADEDGERERRPMVERIGLAAIAVVLAALFGTVAATAWVGGLTLFRG